MKFEQTDLLGAYIISPEYYKDNRGKFGRIFSSDIFENSANFNDKIVQVNHSVTDKKGTFRGFHYQNMPFSETKIIKCIKGSIFDIFIDIRKNSPTFMKHQIVELSEENMKSLFLPKGFAHGFQTITDNVEMIYFHSQFYKPNYQSGINFSDPCLNFKLPLELSEISEKDKNLTFLSNNFKGIKI